MVEYSFVVLYRAVIKVYYSDLFKSSLLYVMLLGKYLIILCYDIKEKFT